MLITLAQARFPKPDFTSGYEYPDMDLVPFYASTDAFKLLLYIALMVFVGFAIYKWRSKKLLLLASFVSVAIIGFYLKACPCPVGLFQGTFDFIFNLEANYNIIYFLIFALPIVFALFVGRVFCGGACPLGAFQELLFVKELKIPKFIDKLLRLVPYFIICACISFASVSGPAIACAYDPIVPVFRMNAFMNMSIVSAVFVILCIFISRPYCKYFCPYSVLLKSASYLSNKSVKITKGKCIGCALCEPMCPNGAIIIPDGKFVDDKKIMRIKNIILLLPVFVLVGLLIGYVFGLWLYEFHPALTLYADLKNSVDDFNTQVYWQNHTSLQYIEDVLVSLRWKMSMSSAITMAVMSLLVAWDLIRSAKKRHSTEYEVDKGLCYLCGRCYASCPVEVQSLKEESK